MLGFHKTKTKTEYSLQSYSAVNKQMVYAKFTSTCIVWEISNKAFFSSVAFGGKKISVC